MVSNIPGKDGEEISENMNFIDVKFTCKGKITNSGMCFVSTEKSTKYGVYGDNLRLGNIHGCKSNFLYGSRKPKSGFQVSLVLRVIEISPRCSGIHLFTSRVLIS